MMMITCRILWIPAGVADPGPGDVGRGRREPDPCSGADGDPGQVIGWLGDPASAAAGTGAGAATTRTAAGEAQAASRPDSRTTAAVRDSGRLRRARWAPVTGPSPASLAARPAGGAGDRERYVAGWRTTLA